jgi:hypothetical protein
LSPDEHEFPREKGEEKGLKIDKPSLIPARATFFSEYYSEKTKIDKGHSIEIRPSCQEFIFPGARAIPLAAFYPGSPRKSSPFMKKLTGPDLIVIIRPGYLNKGTRR